jgi:hypothetical protein
MNTYNFALPHVVNPGLLPLFPDVRDAFCRWFEDFARRLAPLDFGTTPLYVVDVPLGGPSYTLGFAGQSLDLCYQEQIGERWQGRGACFAVDLQQVQDDAERDEGNQERQRDLFVRRAIELALHEIGHTLTHNRLFDPDTTPAAAKEFLGECLNAPLIEPADTRVSWIAHGGDYLRTVIHLEHRAAKLLGRPIKAKDLAGAPYGLSEGEAYRAALADEPKQLDGGRLSVIKQLPPPRAFIDLWRADLESWYGRIKNPSAFQAHLMEHGQELLSK